MAKMRIEEDAAVRLPQFIVGSNKSYKCDALDCDLLKLQQRREMFWYWNFVSSIHGLREKANGISSILSISFSFEKSTTTKLGTTKSENNKTTQLEWKNLEICWKSATRSRENLFWADALKQLEARVITVWISKKKKKKERKAPFRMLNYIGPKAETLTKRLNGFKKCDKRMNTIGGAGRLVLRGAAGRRVDVLTITSEH